ncbi:MAG: winged helix-turn-helix domain-containing protein [Gammaproteobacteria bacterium]
MKKPTTTTEKTTPKAKAEKPVAAVEAKTKTAAKKPPAEPKAPKKAPVPTAQPETSAPDIPVAERIGLTAGSIWHYLNDNGPTTTAKLIKDLEEEEKIIQRSLGWLAQEEKIVIETNGRVETVVLKD